MTAPNPPRSSTASVAPARGIPIRTVPRAALEALVKRLVVAGIVPEPTFPAPSD